MSNLKTFILQHEIITPGYENHVIPNGTIFRQSLSVDRPSGGSIYVGDNGDIFLSGFVETKPDWFKPEGITGTGETSTRNTEAKTTQPDSECYKVKGVPNGFGFIENMFSSKTQLSGDQLNQIMGLSRKFDYENEKSEKVEEPESVKIGDSVLYGASKSKLQPSGDILLFDIFALVGGKFIPVRVDQSDIGMYNYIWKLEDKHQPKTGNEKVEEPEAVRFAKWKDGNYAKDEGFYYELRPAEHKDTWNPDRGYKLSELYTKFKQEAK